jgi:rubrerythrin
MRIEHIHELSEDEDRAEFSLILKCVNCERKWKAIGANDFDYFNREVYELRCPGCGYQDQPTSPCPYCDTPKPELRVVEGNKE